MNTTIIWIILSAILLIACIFFGASWAKAARERDENAEKLGDMNAMRAQLDRALSDNYQNRRRIDSLSDALEDERAYSDELEAALNDREKRLAELNQRIDQANTLRSRAERDASSSLFKVQLYERQFERMREEHRQLEHRYREKSDECRALIAASESAPKRKSKKSETLDQITMSELFDL